MLSDTPPALDASVRGVDDEPSWPMTGNIFASRLGPPARLLGRLATAWAPSRWPTRSPTAALAFGLEQARSHLFLAESLPLLWLQRPGRRRRSKPPPPEAIEAVVGRLQALLERDAERLADGMAPLSLLLPEDPLGHGARWLRILADGVSVSARRRGRRHREFGREAKRWLAELPAYYRRNFHDQTDGYLSMRSAELYDHQVELLFRGGAEPMRRLVLPSLRDALGPGDGRGLHLLELGTGTGAATRAVAAAFPAAKITCLDLSYPYLRHARRRLQRFERLAFAQGDASDLDFRSGRFDAVFSVFMLHELPLPVREVVLDECFRVLRPGGVLAIVDSVQKGDDAELDWALDFFPRTFHEPYFASYVNSPLEPQLKAAGFQAPKHEIGYLAKATWVRKPLPRDARDASPS